MPKFTKQKAHLNRFALDKKNNSTSGNENQLEINLEQFSHEESEESWFEEGIDRELDENSKQSEAKKNAEKNGQLITAFFEKSGADVSSENEKMTEIAISDLEKQLKNNDFSNGYKLQLTAVLQYLKLVKLGKKKLESSISIANQLDRDDEDIKLRIAEFLHEKNFKFNINDFINHLSSVVFPCVGVEKETNI
ncbi:5026_t:CDS:2, partial [Entrophospora sp. SA101]